MKISKILVVSSPGGHWVQLCRLLPAFSDCKIVYACTYEKAVELPLDANYYQIGDINRDSIGKLFHVGSGIFKMLKYEKPTHIISTGALPGLLTLILGKLLGARTIWLDSIANSETISMSGKLASYFANDCFTQWEKLSTSKIKYIGRVI